MLLLLSCSGDGWLGDLFVRFGQRRIQNFSEPHVDLELDVRITVRIGHRAESTRQMTVTC